MKKIKRHRVLDSNNGGSRTRGRAIKLSGESKKKEATRGSRRGSVYMCGNRYCIDYS